MKTLIVAILITFIGCCTANVSTNDSPCVEWIKEHPKPIIVYLNKHNFFDNQYIYTLQDADDNFYPTGPVTLLLPDTIK